MNNQIIQVSVSINLSEIIQQVARNKGLNQEELILLALTSYLIPEKTKIILNE